jgi:hypothetical protein
MSTRGRAVILGLTLATAACGSGGEGRIVDQYFGALNAGDNQTLASFAMVTFKDKVEKWQVMAASPETRTPAALPELIKKGRDLEAAVTENKRKAGDFRNTNVVEYNKYVDVKDKTKIPANLQKFVDEWLAFEKVDKDLRRQIAENKAAVEKERKNTALSVGQLPDLDTMTGEMVEKTLDLALTVNGQVKNYAMGLRKYDLKGTTGSRMVSRWVVQSLQPK